MHDRSHWSVLSPFINQGISATDENIGSCTLLGAARLNNLRQQVRCNEFFIINKVYSVLPRVTAASAYALVGLLDCPKENEN